MITHWAGVSAACSAALIGSALAVACGVSIPTAGAFAEPHDGRQAASVSLSLGNGELIVRDGAAAGQLVSGDSSIERPELVRSGVAGSVALTGGGTQRTEVRLASGVELGLRIERGDGPATIHLSALRVASLAYQAGTGSCSVTLPRGGVDRLAIQLDRGAISIEVPASLGVRLSVQGQGPVYLPAGWYRVGDAYESPGFADAAERSDITVSRTHGPLRLHLR